jgi:hypothetical protein
VTPFQPSATHPRRRRLRGAGPAHGPPPAASSVVGISPVSVGISPACGRTAATVLWSTVASSCAGRAAGSSHTRSASSGASVTWLGGSVIGIPRLTPWPQRSEPSSPRRPSGGAEGGAEQDRPALDGQVHQHGRLSPRPQRSVDRRPAGSARDNRILWNISRLTYE